MAINANDHSFQGLPVLQANAKNSKCELCSFTTYYQTLIERMYKKHFTYSSSVDVYKNDVKNWILFTLDEERRVKLMIYN
ncbi:MAG: hypothetical protein EBT80_04090 [Chitinophagales bacterium]|jgi:hypothetical protein|nr:hypothetical protein [Chitinophagales bacterium]